MLLTTVSMAFDHITIEREMIKALNIKILNALLTKDTSYEEVTTPLRK